MRLGLWNGVGTLNAAAKAQASYSLIMQQTSKTQGDFARTSMGLAKQQKILSSTFEDVKATIGTALLPVMTQIAAQMNAWLSDPVIVSGLTAFAVGVASFAGEVLAKLPLVIAEFQTIVVWLQNNEGVVVGILAALGVAATVWGITTLAAAAPVIAAMLPVIAILAAVGVAAYILYTAWTENWGGIQQTAAAATAWISGIIAAFIATVQAWWAANGASITATAQATWATITATIAAATAWIIATVTAFVAAVSAFWTAHGAEIVAVAQATWDTILAVVSTVTGVISSVVAAFAAALAGDWRGFGQNMRAAWDAAWAAIVGAVTAALGAILGVVGNIISGVVSAFQGVDWGAVGAGIISGIAAGISGGVGALVAAATSAAQAALDAAMGFFGIHSPSKVFRGIGKNLMLAQALGIRENARVPAMAAVQAAEGVSRATTTSITVNPHYYRGDEPSLMQELGMISAFAGAI